MCGTVVRKYWGFILFGCTVHEVIKKSGLILNVDGQPFVSSQIHQSPRFKEVSFLIKPSCVPQGKWCIFGILWILRPGLW